MGPNIFPVPYQVLANEQKKLNLESKFETNPDLKIIFLKVGITVDRKATNLSMFIWNQNPSVFSQ